MQDPKRFGAFVNSVCNNVLLEFLHRTAHDVSSGDDVPEMRDTSMPIDESLITTERKKAVEAILKTLSPQDREILRLVFFENVDRHEICRRLGKDPGYVRVILYRAKSRFEAAFQKSYGHFASLALLVCNGIAAGITMCQIDL